ncbi:ankyrin [Penicillium riverlandense]|uniref:ankyrin n=1 Tax=Penicillium riverlandense TaxID=1903569 RepID=UPI00254852F6|nr:ankyrin [Penicillium riverlandense]KAJ5832422.1 ankyrin [Penicillium riverlandense]
MARSVTGLLDLPNELLFEITQFLEYGWDLTAFGVANRRLSEIVNTYLYQQNLPNCSNAVLRWIAENGNDDAFARCLKADILAYVDKPITMVALRNAICHGHVKIVEHLIKNGITSIHKEEKTNRRAVLRRLYDTPLIRAVNKGRIAVARVLVGHGVGDLFSLRNSELLTHAAWKGDLAMMKYLVKEVGLDPKKRSTGALGAAAESGRTRAIELLLEQGANPNLQSEHEGLPLMIAAKQGHIEIVRLLLAYGTNVNPTPAHQKLPIYSAMSTSKGNRGNRVAITSLIADHMNLNLLRIGDDNRVTLLTIAAALGRDKLVQELLQEGCYPNQMSSEGFLYYNLLSQGPLEWACEAGHDSVVKILLQFGVIGNDRKPLARAIQNGHPQVAKILLDRYLEDYRRTSWFNKLLLSALKHDACFDLLLDHGANPTGVVKKGKCLIQHVLESERPSLAHALLRRGFPLEFLPELLPSIQEDRERSIVLSASRGGVSMLETLFQNGLDPLAVDDDDIQYAISDAIRREDVPVASFFLNRGFTVPCDDLLPECISHAARLKSSDSPTEMLLDTLLRSGVDINARDEHQRTCIWEAITLYYPNQLDVLLQRGADPLLQDENGDSSLIFAATRTPSLILYVKCAQTILEWIDIHRTELSREELCQELSKAESGAVKHDNKRIARMLQRFKRVHFDSV